jgi:hypothetical protein
MIISEKTLFLENYFFNVLIHIPDVERISEIINKLETTIGNTVHIYSSFPNHDFGKILLPIKWN